MAILRGSTPWYDDFFFPQELGALEGFVDSVSSYDVLNKLKTSASK